MTRLLKRHFIGLVRKRMVMFYLLFGFPALLTYAVLLLFTDLSGKSLFYSMIPVVVLLAIIYILYLVRPARFFHFWGATPSEHNTP